MFKFGKCIDIELELTRLIFKNVIQWKTIVFGKKIDIQMKQSSLILFTIRNTKIQGFV